MKKVYDAADNGKGCYDAAIEAKRLRGDDYYLKPKASEAIIHAGITTYLRSVLPSAMVITINNNPRSAIDGARQKKLGLVKGTPDIMIVRQGGSVAFLEVKKEGGRLNPAQVEFRDRCSVMQIPYAVVRSIDDVRDTLAGWGVKMREAA